MTSPILYFVDDLAEGVSTGLAEGVLANTAEGVPANTAEGVPAPAVPYHRVDPGAPQITVTDLSVTRGDGIFETAGVLHRDVQALEAHLRRFAASARILDLPAPRLEVWREAILAAVRAYDSDEPGYVKFIMTRGIEGTGVPVGWAYVATAEDFSAERGVGIRVVTLDRGYRHDVAKTSPWLLQGAKTLSYAVNKAVLREAARRGADDVLFVSSDGFALEGPTSTLLARYGDTYATPSTDQGILAGTTQASVFDWLEEQGCATEYRQITAAELPRADALWLLSSSRLAAPVQELDSMPVVVDTEMTARINAALEARVS